jgi:hypothetical protein
VNFSEADFRQKLLDFGRFRAFKTTVKYTGRFYLNHETAAVCAKSARFPQQYQYVILYEEALSIIAP